MCNVISLATSNIVSLLMKQSPYLTELALFDVVPVVVGVAVDLSHINTPSVVKGYTKDNDGLAQALKGADIVVIPAGVPRKPGMTRCASNGIEA